MPLFNCYRSYRWLIPWTFYIFHIDLVSTLTRDCDFGTDQRAGIPLCKLLDFSAGSVDDVFSPAATNYLAALSIRATNKIYPTRVHTFRSLKRFDELPFPLPVGASLYFCTLTLVLLTWYIKSFVWTSLHKMADKIELFPETVKFPRVQLYNLQQSNREARLRRETRNTWAWMANKYLLRPNDPKVNTDIFKTTWSDFDIPKDVWGTVRAVMKVNAWFNRAKNRVQKGVPVKPPKFLVPEPFDPKKEDLKDRLEELKKDVDPSYEPHTHLVGKVAPVVPPRKPALKKKAPKNKHKDTPHPGPKVKVIAIDDPPHSIVQTKVEHPEPISIVTDDQPHIIIQPTEDHPHLTIQPTEDHPHLTIQPTEDHPHLTIQPTEDHPHLTIQPTEDHPHLTIQPTEDHPHPIVPESTEPHPKLKEAKGQHSRRHSKLHKTKDITHKHHHPHVTLDTHEEDMFEIIKDVPHGTVTSSHVEMPDPEPPNNHENG